LGRERCRDYGWALVRRDNKAVLADQIDQIPGIPCNRARVEPVDANVVEVDDHRLSQQNPTVVIEPRKSLPLIADRCDSDFERARNVWFKTKTAVKLTASGSNATLTAGLVIILIASPNHRSIPCLVT